MTDGSGEAGSGGPARVPTITAEVRDDGTGELRVDGSLETIARSDLAEAGAEVTSRVAALAARLGSPVPMEVRDPDGLWSLVVHPDGRVDQAAPDGAPATAAATVAAASATTAASPAPPARAAATQTPPAATRTPGGGAPLPTLEDLVTTRRSERREPARRGWRHGVALVTFGGITPGPGRAERRERAAVHALRRPLDGPRTVVVVNPKGGAHKTTATMLLAATFGLQRGGYTLAWDNNETHGTLGWRATPAQHERTAVDLLRTMPVLAARGTVRIGDLDGYVRTQPTEQFDVLASDEDAASAASVDAESFRNLHRLLSQFYRVLVIDTGNNMRASNWRAAIEAADQLVVVSTVREDTAQSAAWALDALRASGHEDAVRRAVTILSDPAPRADRDLRKRLRSHFGALTRAVVEVPYEPELVGGGRIAYRKLRPATREAWLYATATVAEGL
ncbi:MAG: chromosome partitioning protein [Cellulomonas sp. 73-92]|uniref:MinD/ParA family ATP-binding protein n=1 Tax=Cellulomonas sp. 73-92 TaxID=1895740 RepID=UPI00092616CF|nr:chromosome partitioning protein [Cellulomonas sp. 73-92]OJV80784.1 MAG: chromosome partitioning protein [Cellulomonas sp. 73-92]